MSEEIYRTLVKAGFVVVEDLEVPQPPYEDWSIVDVETVFDHILAEMWKLAPEIARNAKLQVHSIEQVILAVAEQDSVANPPYPPRE